MTVKTLIPAAGAAALALLLLIAGPQPAAARRSVPDYSGSYVGHFRGNNGNFWPVELNVTVQVRRQISGRMNVAAMIVEAPFRGTVSASERVSLKARTSSSSPFTQIKLRGTYRVEPGGASAMLEGTYSMTGAIRETGVFALRAMREM